MIASTIIIHKTTPRHADPLVRTVQDEKNFAMLANISDDQHSLRHLLE